MKATFPEGSLTMGRKEEVKRFSPLRMPVVFGPTIRMPASRAMAITSSSSRLPSSLPSEKPELLMMTAWIPFLAQSLITSTAAPAGVAMTAVSTWWGIWSTAGYALRPKISSAFRLTG